MARERAVTALIRPIIAAEVDGLGTEGEHIRAFMNERAQRFRRKRMARGREELSAQ